MAMQADALSLEQKTLLMAGKTMFHTLDIPAVGLEGIRMVDGPMGITSGRIDERDVSLLTPCGTSLGASWDRELVVRIGELIGDEAVERDIQVVLGPNLNLPRSPLAGRSFETFSEDPLLTGVLGASWIRGLQGKGVGSSAKHLVANDSETDRHEMNSVVDERALREVYLLPFEFAAAEGVWAMMAAYNRVNGAFAVESAYLLKDAMRRDWKFDGVVMSDWFGTHDTVRSALAGLDLEMPGPPRVYGARLRQAVEDGQVDEASLEVSVERIFKLAQRVGKTAITRRAAPAELSSMADRRQLLKQAAAAGFVLLKNKDGLLPLDLGKDKKLAVIGPNAAVPCYQGGTFARINVDLSVPTPLQAIREAYDGICDVAYEAGVPTDYRRPPLEALRIHPEDEPLTPGLRVEFYAGHEMDGPPLATEVRNTSSLVWFAQMPGLGAIDRPGMLRATATLMPDVDGNHTFFVGGTGEVRLCVDGVELVRAESELTKKDLMGALKRGDSESATVTLKAGRIVRLDFQLRFQPGRAVGFWFGCSLPRMAGGIARAVKLAGDADVVLLMLGETQESALESVDRTTTKLPANQLELLDAVSKANPKTIVALNVAHAVDVDWLEKTAALLMTWFPGQEFGAAIAAVLKGELEPGGRLPVTFAADEEDYPAFWLDTDEEKSLHYTESNLIGYRSFLAKNLVPRFEFGAGFGYAAFEWTGFHIEQTGATATVRPNIRNTGARSGKEVVQVYVEGPGVPRSLQQFAAVVLAAGEQREVTLQLQARCFAHWSGEKQSWEIAPGAYRLFVGQSSTRIAFTAEVVLHAEDVASAEMQLLP